MAVTHSIIVGIFDNYTLTEHAIEALYNAGFSGDQIKYTSATPGGFFQSIKNVFSGGGDTTLNDLIRDLKGLGVSDDEVNYYTDEYRVGHVIVAVNADGREQEVRTILRVNGGHDFSSRSGGSAETTTSS